MIKIFKIFLGLKKKEIKAWAKRQVNPKYWQIKQFLPRYDGKSEVCFTSGIVWSTLYIIFLFGATTFLVFLFGLFGRIIWKNMDVWQAGANIFVLIMGLFLVSVPVYLFGKWIRDNWRKAKALARKQRGKK